jgi:hypothetical protein
MLVRCFSCGSPRWTGYGPCSDCGAASPEYVAETKRINQARSEAGLPPLGEGRPICCGNCGGDDACQGCCDCPEPAPALDDHGTPAEGQQQEPA